MTKFEKDTLFTLLRMYQQEIEENGLKMHNIKDDSATEQTLESIANVIRAILYGK